jgi:outer membrane protein OmpA-like peptidoglycan-associated protein
MENTAYINKGDSTIIHWNFYNARGVQIQGRYRIFNIQDSVYVTSDTSTIYNVTAFGNNKDDLTIKWNVIVNDDKPHQVATKPIKDISGNPINEISIIGTDFLSDNQYRFNYLALSPTDAFITDAKFSNNNFDIKIPSRVNAKIKIDSCGIFMQTDSISNGICFCIDNSDANIYHKQILDAIETSSEYFNPNDNFYLSLFNHNLQSIIELEKNDNGKFDNSFKNTIVPSGFCAINTSVAITINYLTKSQKNINTIILITSSGDNASVLYDENELLEHAKKNGIKIYVLAIGQSTSTYNLSKLADGTGGKLFLIDESQVESISYYLNEIVFGIRNHYFVDITFNKPDNLTGVDFNLNIIDKSDSKLSDNVSVILKKEKLYFDYQVVVGFENNEKSINTTYDNSISRLSQVLKNNPNLVIELIGNSSIMEGNEQECKKLALYRAQLVRKRLIDSGVKQEQIRITNNGSESPIYIFPTNIWQHKYNNRVEVRWLVLENYPYEIISDKLISPSETIALEQIEALEAKGYKAYYQGIIKNERPAYRIIIWGYQTADEANIALKDINKKLKQQCYIRQLQF